MNRKIIIGIIIALVVLTSLAGLFLAPIYSAARRTPETDENTVGIIYLEGVIMGGSSAPGLFGIQSGSDSVLRQLREAQKDDVKAVVIRINSPGGSAAASQEIRDEVVKLKKSGKKVVVSMGDVAASGGYWVASAADKIVANPATITGSIGVIMQFSNMTELYDKIGIKPITIKSKPFKDIGSPAREMTETERQILQGMVDDIYAQFIKVVSEGRNMDPAEVEKIADGRIFTGRQAKELGLVDELGNFYDAIDIAADLAGIEKPVKTKTYTRKSALDILLERANSITTCFGRFTFRLEDVLRLKDNIF